MTENSIRVVTLAVTFMFCFIATLSFLVGNRVATKEERIETIRALKDIAAPKMEEGAYSVILMDSRLSAWSGSSGGVTVSSWGVSY